jgi:hypothetical protein
MPQRATFALPFTEMTALLDELEDLARAEAREPDIDLTPARAVVMVM